jgi:pimeloyl-ACP methyl ester carboxylesterase
LSGTTAGAFCRPGLPLRGPNLRGFEQSSAPADVSAYRPKHLVQDIAALIAVESPGAAGLPGGARLGRRGGLEPGQPAAAAEKRLAIINSPHPGTFLRELQNNPKQQAASAYMNFLVRPTPKPCWPRTTSRGCGLSSQGRTASAPAWLTEAVRDQYRAVWRAGLTGGCNYYRASPLRPPGRSDPGAAAVALPRSMLTVDVPTLVVWGMDDVALPPELIDGLPDYVPQLTCTVSRAPPHWIVHEQPGRVAGLLEGFLGRQ